MTDIDWLTHDDPDRTLACPECDRGHRWYVRQDETVRCRDCDHECEPDDLVDRPTERGEHTPRSARARGGRVAGNAHSDEFLRRIAGLPNGPTGAGASS